MRTIVRLAVWSSLAALVACSSGDGGRDSGSDMPEETDAEPDADADVPADLSAEVDAEVEAEAETEAGPDADADADEAGEAETTDDGAGSPCDDEDCSGHGSCSDSTGVAVCSCDEGYAGPACATCAPGWIVSGADCIPDPLCATYEFARTSFTYEITLGGPGFDLDGDGTPDNYIADNALMPGLVNPQLQTALESGELCLLFEHRGLEAPAASVPYDLGVLDCTDPDGVWTDWSAGTGVFQVLRSSLGDPVCEPLAERTMRTDAVTGGALSASGATVIGLPGILPLPGLVTALHDVHLEATLVSLTGGIGMTTIRVGGYVVVDEFVAALEAWVAAGGVLPVDPAVLVGMLGTPDIDRNGDGTMDAWSIGYEMEATSAQADGVVPD